MHLSQFHLGLYAGDNCEDPYAMLLHGGMCNWVPYRWMILSWACALFLPIIAESHGLKYRRDAHWFLLSKAGVHYPKLWGHFVPQGSVHSAFVNSCLNILAMVCWESHESLDLSQLAFTVGLVNYLYMSWTPCPQPSHILTCHVWSLLIILSCQICFSSSAHRCRVFYIIALATPSSLSLKGRSPGLPLHALSMESCLRAFLTWSSFLFLALLLQRRQQMAPRLRKTGVPLWTYAISSMRERTGSCRSLLMLICFMCLPVIKGGDLLPGPKML